MARAAAPITPSGLNTQVNLSATPPPGKTQYDITGGTRPGGGVNLFHSFGQFNVPNNNIANFLNDSGLATSNILGRVTGGNISNIFGTIQTTGFGNANLFMMNPAGFLFGPNATVNVGGMVAFTSADYLRLGDGKLFNAAPNPNADALLSAAPVAAFGFLGSNPGAITVQGSQFAVTPGTGISLVGGNITIQSGTLDNGTVQPARFSAPNGQINLATAASPGEFLQNLTAAPNVNNASFTSFGSVHLAKGATVDVSQTGNGKVSIRGGQLVIDIQNALLSTADSAAPPVTVAGQDTILISPGNSIITNTSSADRGPDVQIVADSINVAGTPPGPGPPNFARITTLTSGSGDAGNISLTTTQNIALTAATISSLSQPVSQAAPIPTGNSGNISLTSTEGNISLTNTTTVTPQSNTSFGNAGSITVSAPHGDVFLDSAALFSFQGPLGFGNSGGGIQVTANNLTLRSSVAARPASIQIDNFNPVVPGNITVTLSGNLSLDGQASIQTISRGPALAASDLTITAHDMSLTNGSFLSTQTFSSGQGGHLNVFTDNLQLTNGAQLLSSSVSGKSGQTFTNPTGPGGTINIQGLSGPAVSVLVDGAKSGLFTNTTGTGAGGNVFVNAHSVTLQHNGTISASTTGAGNAGSIQVSADSVSVMSGATVASSSSIRTTPANPGEVIPPLTGNASTVTIQGLASPAQSVLIDGAGSGVFTNTQGAGAGGDIHLLANAVTLQNGASISASSTGPGPTGNITINAGNQFAMTKSSVTTEADQSSGGKITITTNPNGIVQLTDSKISASVLDGAGGGGSVTIDPQFVLLQNSQILAKAFSGPGGNIFITTNLLQQDSTSIISASSQFGQNGTITVQSPIAPASRIIVLSQKPLIATSLLTQRCAALAGGNYSSFTVAGRDSLPAEPSSWLSSPLALATAESGGGTGSEPETPTRLSEPTEEMPILSLRRIAPPGFLTQSFAGDWSGCTS
ncbi:MAG TPA: filamentous hemagglutinin N-terminal domain-containing protein [Nitrospira sp.]|nr:filamentous hemagglutinin N-terminal domain-containing protein [Nitrospira sp.]